MQPSPRVPVSRCIESQPESYFHGDASVGKTSSALSSLLLEGKHSVGYVCIVGESVRETEIKCSATQCLVQVRGYEWYSVTGMPSGYIHLSMHPSMHPFICPSHTYWANFTCQTQAWFRGGGEGNEVPISRKLKKKFNKGKWYRTINSQIDLKFQAIRKMLGRNE